MMSNSTSALISHLHRADGYDFPDLRSRAIDGADISGHTVRRGTRVVPFAPGMLRARVRVSEIDSDIQEFRLSSDCADVVFLRRGLVILYRNGFCTLDPLKYVFSLKVLSGIC